MEMTNFDCPSCGPVDLQVGDWPFDCKGFGHLDSRYIATPPTIHNSERTVVYRHPQHHSMPTEYPDIRPGRANMPMHSNYSERGYQRMELDTHVKAAAYEKEQGVRIERRHYDKNSARAERDMSAE